jgi:hypothetical protein
MSLDGLAQELKEIAREAETNGTAVGLLLARACRALASEFEVPSGPTLGQVIGTVVEESPRRWWGSRKRLGDGTT